MNDRERPSTDDKAATWAARSLSGNMSALEQRSLNDWLSENTQNQQTYMEYTNIIARTDQAWMAFVEKIIEYDLEQFAS